MKHRNWLDRSKMSRRSVLAGGLATMVPSLAKSAAPLTKVTLSILFIPRGDFSPYYLARERGYYRDAGIDLTIKHVLGNAFAFQMLSAGTADFAHADIVQMLQLQGKTAEPQMRSVAIVCDQNPLSLFFLSGRGISRPEDLEGRTIVDSPGSTTPALIRLFAKANGLDASKISWKNAAASAKTALMLQGQADAVSIYQPAFPSAAAKVPAGQTLKSFNFGERGVDIYGDGLISTEGYLRERPEIARSFVQASMRGYRDAFADPAAAVDALLKSSPELDRGNGIKEMEIMRDSNSGPIPTTRGLGFHDAYKMEATYRAVTEVLEQPMARPVTDFYTNDFLANVADGPASGRAR